MSSRGLTLESLSGEFVFSLVVGEMQKSKDCRKSIASHGRQVHGTSHDFGRVQCMLYRGLLLMPMDRSNATNAIISGNICRSPSTRLIGCVCRQSLGCTTIGLFYPSILILLDKCTGGRFGRVTAILITTGVFCKLHRLSLTLIVRGTCCTPSRQEILLFPMKMIRLGYGPYHCLPT